MSCYALRVDDPLTLHPQSVTDEAVVNLEN